MPEHDQADLFCRASFAAGLVLGMLAGLAMACAAFWGACQAGP